MLGPTGFPDALSVKYEKGVTDSLKVSGQGKLEAWGAIDWNRDDCNGSWEIRCPTRDILFYFILRGGKEARERMRQRERESIMQGSVLLLWDHDPS